MLDVGYESDGLVVAKTAIGGPLSPKGRSGRSPQLLNGRVDGTGSSTMLPWLAGGSGSRGAAAVVGRHLPLVLLLSCFVAALAAVAGPACHGALARILDLPRFS